MPWARTRRPCCAPATRSTRISSAAAAISFANAGALSAEFFPWNDANGDNVITRDEVDLSRLVYFYGLDPANPSSTISPNVIDPNLKAGKT